MSKLSAYQLNSLQLRNLIAIGPMCRYSAGEAKAIDWRMIHLGHLAVSGGSLMILEASAVTPDGRITADDLGLQNDDNEAALAKVIAAIRRHSAVPPAIQLGHAGRKASSHATKPENVNA